MENQTEVKEIKDRAGLTGSDYQPEEDGAIEPLPPTAAEALEYAPGSAFSGYVGLLRNEN